VDALAARHGVRRRLRLHRERAELAQDLDGELDAVALEEAVAEVALDHYGGVKPLGLDSSLDASNWHFHDENDSQYGS
jgi:hypothetical protein